MQDYNIHGEGKNLHYPESEQGGVSVFAFIFTGTCVKFLFLNLKSCILQKKSCGNLHFLNDILVVIVK